MADPVPGDKRKRETKNQEEISFGKFMNKFMAAVVAFKKACGEAKYSNKTYFNCTLLLVKGFKSSNDKDTLKPFFRRLRELEKASDNTVSSMKDTEFAIRTILKFIEIYKRKKDDPCFNRHKNPLVLAAKSVAAAIATAEGCANVAVTYAKTAQDVAESIKPQDLAKNMVNDPGYVPGISGNKFKYLNSKYSQRWDIALNCLNISIAYINKTHTHAVAAATAVGAAAAAVDGAANDVVASFDNVDVTGAPASAYARPNKIHKHKGNFAIKTE